MGHHNNMRQKIQARKTVVGNSPELQDDEENEGGEGEPDLHQCGHCKQMFYNFTKYITHKLQKVCWSTDVVTPTEEVAPWTMERNGSSSPEEQPKEKTEEDIEHQQQGNVEVKNLHHELQKRKHRKGMVRRLKPPEDIHLENSESVVYVPTEEETVFVQTEPTKEEAQDSDGNDSKELIQMDLVKSRSADILTSKNSPTGKYGVSLYNYSKAKKTVQNTSQMHSNINLGQNKSSQQLQSSTGSKNYNRGRYPEFYPEKGSRYAEGNYYRKNKYGHDTPAHHRTSITTSSHSRSNNRYKDTYASYDHYSTMVTMTPKSRKPLSNKTPPKRDIADNNKEKENMEISDDNIDNVNEHQNTNENTKTLEIEPPELVHVSPSLDDQIELTPTLDKSPPALEKIESSNADDDLLKIEEDDSINDTEEHPEDTVQSPTAAKFVNMPSPDKESNSPQGSLNSHDPEEFNQDFISKDTSEIYLPRHRQLSESTVERLITEPISQADASWKHAKQVYRCPLCAKIFPFKSKLQRHVLVHTGIKPYKCTVCGRGFTQQIDLQRHLTRHTGEKPFKCHLCKAQFIRADNLRKHCKDAHYVNIEEPIRKRRRKTTGSDTVLPPLEVAIALALSETERNGGRVLGRAATRSNTRASTTTTTTKQQHSRFAAESGFQQPPRPAESSTSTSYSARMPSHAESHLPYPPTFPPHLGPHARYPFQHPPESRHGYAMGRRPKSPDYHPNSPPYHREGRYTHPRESPVRYYQGSAPPARGYYVRAGYEREGEPFYSEKEEHSVGGQASSRLSPLGFQVQEYHSMALEKTSPSFMEKRPIRGNEEGKYLESRSTRKHPEGNHRGEIPEDVRFRSPEVDTRYGSRPSVTSKHSIEYVQPREGDEEGSTRSSASYYGQPHSEDDHRVLFRGKQSISYGDFGPSTSHTPEEYERPSTSSRIGEKLSPSQQQDYPSYKQKPTADDPGEFITMATEREPQILIQPRPVSTSPPPELIDTQGNVYVDEEETPIVRPSDDPSIQQS